MPSSLSTSSVVCGAKDKKSHGRKCKKPCASSSSSTCCSEQCINCCTSQYQRLSNFANLVAYNQVYYAGSTNSTSWIDSPNTNAGGTIYNRSGVLVPPPNPDVGTTGETPLDGAYYNTESGCSAAGDPYLPQDLDDLVVAQAAYYFVNEFSYGPYEPGCHNDQVYGWFVNIYTGELQLFTQFDGVPTNATRACLASDTSVMSSAQRRQLKVLNRLYKLSKAAVKEVNGIPSQNGNIVEVCDCKGERWLLFIDTAGIQNGSPLSTTNYEFAVVACKLC